MIAWWVWWLVLMAAGWLLLRAGAEADLCRPVLWPSLLAGLLFVAATVVALYAM